MVLPSETREDNLSDETTDMVALDGVCVGGSKVVWEEARHLPDAGRDEQLEGFTNLEIGADYLLDETETRNVSDSIDAQVLMDELSSRPWEDYRASRTA